jgi:hypothetical protein
MTILSVYEGQIMGIVVKTLLIVLGVFILASAVAGYICYQTLAVPNMRPLTPENRALCAKLVKEGKAYPFVCARAAKTGMCPCLPCKKLNEAQKPGKGP